MRRLILVKSCQRFRDRRAACEETWAGELCDQGVTVYFVEGGYETEGAGDGLIRVTTGDGYNDNSFKVREAIRIALNIEPFDHLFICDDNTFLHWRRWLAFQPSSDFIGLHNPPTIPWVHGGAGWYMSRRACELFIDGIKRRCSWDDQLASEILNRHGIELENHPELFAQWDERVAADNSLIACHNVEPHEQRTLFRSTYDLPALHDLLR